jgi:hypothetical protein
MEALLRTFPEAPGHGEGALAGVVVEDETTRAAREETMVLEASSADPVVRTALSSGRAVRTLSAEEADALEEHLRAPLAFVQS